MPRAWPRGPRAWMKQPENTAWAISHRLLQGHPTLCQNLSPKEFYRHGQQWGEVAEKPRQDPLWAGCNPYSPHTGELQDGKEEQKHRGAGRVWDAINTDMRWKTKWRGGRMEVTKEREEEQQKNENKNIWGKRERRGERRTTMSKREWALEGGKQGAAELLKHQTVLGVAPDLSTTPPDSGSVLAAGVWSGTFYYSPWAEIYKRLWNH